MINIDNFIYPDGTRAAFGDLLRTPHGIAMVVEGRCSNEVEILWFNCLNSLNINTNEEESRIGLHREDAIIDFCNNKIELVCNMSESFRDLERVFMEDKYGPSK